MAFENFPYTNFHEINLDWIVARVKEAYSASNPPDYPVTSVNGQTGDVIIAIPANLVSSVNGETGDVVLYRNPLTQFPATDEQRWNLFRICDGDERGIEFDEDGAHRIEGTRRILIYDEENQPDFPVTSVNGQTGDVRISAGVNSVNGKTGNVVTPFVNPNADILTLDSNSNSVLWGISRQVAGGNVALYISRGTGTPQAFIRYTPDGGDAINLPLLSSADIPEDAGVISVNNKTGVVTLYGNEIQMTLNNGTTISDYIQQLFTALYGSYPYELIRNSYVTQNGAIEVYNGWSRTDYINCENFEKIIVVKTVRPTSSSYNAFYDENKRFISTFNTINELGTIEVPIPERAKYFIISNVTSVINGMTIKLSPGIFEKINTYTSQIAELESENETQQTDIDDLKDTSESIETAITEHNTQISALQAANLTQDQKLSVLETDDSSHAQQIASLQSADATHDQQITALQAKDTTQDQQISELYTRTGIYGIFIENVNSLPLRYPATGTDAKIKSTNMVVGMDLYVSGVQVDAWTINTYDGYLEITGTMNGTSSMTLYLA